jgi:hypothetical protein
MIGRMSVLLASCATVAAAVAVAPAAEASGGPGGGGGGAGQAPGSNCQIKQLSNTPVLLAGSAAIDSAYSLAGCTGDTWGLTFVNTFFGTTDFVASGSASSTGAAQGTVDAAPLPFNYPYRVTLTVTNPGGVVATKSGTLFTPKPRD